MLVRDAKRNHSARRSAFTLLEILVVVAIIVALAGLGAYYLIPQSEKADRDLAKTRVKLVEKAVENYYVDHKDYPQSLQMLLVRDQEGMGPYLRDADAINDPWGQPLGFDPTATDPISGVPRPRIYVMSPKGIDPATQQPISNFVMTQ